jgi:DNA repair photolyase
MKQTEDPTQAVLSESSLNSKSLCDYVINVATGCRHGCRFCYVPSTPQIRTRPDMLAAEADVDDPQREWGDYVLYRDDLPERLDDHLARKRTWKETPGGQGVVGVSFHTDCYMDGRAGEIIRQVVEVLTSHDTCTRVLTRNPILALQDLDVFRAAGEYVTIGSSIPLLNADGVGAIEPHAPAPHHRLDGLQELAADRDLPVHLWPDDQLLEHVDGDEYAWLAAWRDRSSPEPFAGREAPTSPRPAVPSRPRRATLAAYQGGGA